MEILFDDVPEPMVAAEGKGRRPRSSVFSLEAQTARSLMDHMLQSADPEEEEAVSAESAAENMRESIYGSADARSSTLHSCLEPGPILCMAAHTAADGGYRPFVATGGRDGNIRLYSMDDSKAGVFLSPEPFCVLKGHSEAVMCLTTYTPPCGESDADWGSESRSSTSSSKRAREATVIISGGIDQSVRVWEVSNQRSYKVLFGHADTVWCVQVAQPKGIEPIIVSGGLDGNIIMWSLLRGEQMRVISAIPKDVKERGVICLAVYYHPADSQGDSYTNRFSSSASSPPPPLILSGGEDQLINLWSIETGELLKTFVGHSDVVVSLALCQNYLSSSAARTGTDLLASAAANAGARDDLVVSGSRDGTVRIWSLTTTEMIRVLRGHGSSTVFSVFVLPHVVDVEVSGRGVAADGKGGHERAHGEGFEAGGGWLGLLGRAVRWQGNKLTSTGLPSGRQQYPQREAADEGYGYDEEEDLDQDQDQEKDRHEGRPLALRDEARHPPPLQQPRARPVSGLSPASPASASTVSRTQSQSQSQARSLPRAPARVLVRCAVDVAVVSAGKDGKVIMWNLTTGQTVRTMKPHSSAVTAVLAFESKLHSDSGAVAGVDGNSTDAGPRCFNDVTATTLTFITCSTDATVAVLSYSTHDCTAAARQAYANDTSGVFLPLCLRELVPEQFSAWSHLWLLIRQEGMSIDEFFAKEQFSLFTQAVDDRRVDFVELFLPLATTGLVEQGASVMKSGMGGGGDGNGYGNGGDGDGDGGGEEGGRGRQGGGSALSASSQGAGGVGSPGGFDGTAGGQASRSPFSLSPSSSFKARNESVDSLASDLRQGLEGVQRELQGVFSLNDEDQGATSDRFALAAKTRVTLLRLAIALGDIPITLAILDVWKRLVNRPPRDWMEQCCGPFTCLPKSDLVSLARKFPLIFQNFITNLKLQKAHLFVLRECTANLPRGKPMLKSGTDGSLIRDLRVWNVRGETLAETMVAQYLPLAYAADLDMLQAYTDTCSHLDSVEIFQSEVGAAAIKFAWSKFGIRHHRRSVALYMLFVAMFAAFVFTDHSVASVQERDADDDRVNMALEKANRAICVFLGLVVVNQIYLNVRQCSFQKISIFRHFFSFWPFLELVGSIFIFVSIYIGQSIRSSDGKPSLIDHNVPRCLMSVNILIQMVRSLSFFRAFESTGPLVSMIIRIFYDIRYYLFLLAIILFGFSLSFWCLCTGQFDHPTTITFHNIPGTDGTSQAPAWYVAPMLPTGVGPTLNDDPQGTYAFSTIQGAYLESFMYLTGQFSISPFAACGYHEDSQTVNKTVRSFAILLSALFAVLVQVMMVNVLIALMTESYARLSERGMAQARLMQAQLISESSGSIHRRLQKAMSRPATKGQAPENLQPKIIHLLRRAADLIYESESADLGSGASEGAGGASEGRPTDVAGLVLNASEKQSSRLMGIISGTVVEVSSAVSEQEASLHRLRQSLEVLVAKTKKVLA